MIWRAEAGIQRERVPIFSSGREVNSRRKGGEIIAPRKETWQKQPKQTIEEKIRGSHPVAPGNLRKETMKEKKAKRKK